MRLRNIPGSDEVLQQSAYVIKGEGEPDPGQPFATPTKWKGHFSEVFGNDHPIHIEIGMGKGRFITQMARLHPEINYIGIERYSSVLVRAVQRIEGGRRLWKDVGNGSQEISDDMEMKSAKQPETTADGQNKDMIPNLRFLCLDAALLDQVFAPGEVDRIYLNFSDPWPKDRHAKRRLPGKAFLAVYEKILAKDGQIEFKTDNSPLFDFAIEQAGEAGWQMDVCTFDLHNDPELSKGNVMTEYEEKFSAKGNPINKYIIRLPKRE